MKRNTPVYIKELDDGTNVFIGKDGLSINLTSLNPPENAGVTLVVDEETGMFTLTVPDT